MGDLPPGVIQLNNGDGGPRPPQNGGGRLPPVPPMHPMPPGGPGVIRPQPMGPAIPPTANHAMMAMPNGNFPPPPVAIVPRDVTRRGTYEVVDLRSERLTQADAREQLATYIVIRLEKASASNEVNEEGFPVRPTWDKASHIEQTDISQTEATRKVRELERFTEPLADKKNDLSPAVQRQLEHAQERLQMLEHDPRYFYILSQIESQTRKMDLTTTEYISKTKKGKTYVETKQSKPKRKLERVAVTAYFKRMPRPEEDALRMVREKERSAQRHMSHGQMQMPAAMPPQALPALPAPPPHGAFPMQQPMMMGGKGGQKAAKVEVVHGGKKGGGKVYPGSPRSSHTSFDTDDDWSDSGSDYTPNSSIDSSSQYSRRGKHRSRSRHRPRDRPENYGIEAPRNHMRHNQNYTVAACPRTPVLASPQVLTPVDLDRLLEDAYQDGRDHEATMTPRALEAPPPPRIIQKMPSVRRISVADARREIFASDLDREEERLERLRIDDDIRRDREFRRDREADFARREDDLFRDRRMSSRFLPNRYDDEPWLPEYDRAWEERDARDYMDARERHVDIEVNPFAPQNRRQMYPRAYRR